MEKKEASKQRKESLIKKKLERDVIKQEKKSKRNALKQKKHGNEIERAIVTCGICEDILISDTEDAGKNVPTVTFALNGII